MLKKLLASSAVALLTAVPAVAGTLAEPVVEPAPVMPAYEPDTDWTGFYAGVQGVYANFGGTPFWGTGGHAGYLSDMGTMVLGGEVHGTYLPGPNEGWFGANVLLGYDGGSVMPHVTAGVAYSTALGGEFGYGAGAGLSIMATDNIMLTGRYNYTWLPGSGTPVHAGALAVSYRF